jgi:hypothetical protein
MSSPLLGCDAAHPFNPEQFDTLNICAKYLRGRMAREPGQGDPNTK